MKPSDVLAVPVATVHFPEGHPQAGEDGPVLVFAIRTSEGIILVDSGVGPDHQEVERYFRPRRVPLSEALSGRGLALDQVVAVVNTHLHFDHCGNNQLLGGIPIHVQRHEMEEVSQPEYTIAEWVEFPNAHYELIDGDAEISPGVRLVSTPGHTRGHQSVAVETSEGLVVIAGQSIYTVAEWEGASDPRLSGEERAWDRQLYAESARRLHELGPRGIFFSHDAQAAAGR